MKYIIVLIVLSAILSPRAEARLGDSPAEATARYGTLVCEMVHEGLPALMFTKSGMFIVVCFDANKTQCVCLAYRKVEADVLGNAEELTDTEIEYLLNVNASKWEESPQLTMHTQWIANGGDIVAVYESDSRLLVIMTRATQLYLTKRQEEKELSGLKGL